MISIRMNPNNADSEEIYKQTDSGEEIFFFDNDAQYEKYLQVVLKHNITLIKKPKTYPYTISLNS